MNLTFDRPNANTCTNFDVNFFIYFTNFRIKLVHFFSIQNMVTCSSFLFSENRPLSFGISFMRFQLFQCPNILLELRGKINLSVSKHKLLVWTSVSKNVGVPKYTDKLITVKFLFLLSKYAYKV